MPQFKTLFSEVFLSLDLLAGFCCCFWLLFVVVVGCFFAGFFGAKYTEGKTHFGALPQQRQAYI